MRVNVSTSLLARVSEQVSTNPTLEEGVSGGGQWSRGVESMSIVGVQSPSISGVEGNCMLISECWQWGRPSKGEGTSKLLREAKGRE